MNESKLVLNSIIGESIGGYSRVTVSRDVFLAVTGPTPTAKFEEKGRDASMVNRVFNFNGVELYSSYDKATRKTMFLMKTTDAEKCLPSASDLPFNIGAFDRSVVATA